jgi:hypothetical protein
MKVIGQLLALAASFLTEETPHPQYPPYMSLGGRADMNTMEKRKISFPSWKTDSGSLATQPVT